MSDVGNIKQQQNRYNNYLRVMSKNGACGGDVSVEKRKGNELDAKN